MKACFKSAFLQNCKMLSQPYNFSSYVERKLQTLSQASRHDPKSTHSSKMQCNAYARRQKLAVQHIQRLGSLSRSGCFLPSSSSTLPKVPKSPPQFPNLSSIHRPPSPYSLSCIPITTFSHATLENLPSAFQKCLPASCSLTLPSKLATASLTSTFEWHSPKAI